MMPRIPAALTVPAIVGSALVLPFMILEVRNRGEFDDGFPLALFVVMWLLSASFIFVLTPIVRDLGAGSRATAHPRSLVPRVVLLILITWLWVGLVIDQMPCFLGVPNCD
jgi:hypothetical protein